MRPKTFTTTSASQTRALGTKLAGELKGGELLALTGHLGSGKTTFLKGLAKGLGVKDTVTSPTFVLMKVYPAKHKNIRTFVHVDCYRLPAGRHGVPGVELAAIGLGDYLADPNTVVAIEWAEKLPKKFKPNLTLAFTVVTKVSGRIIKLKKYPK